MHNRYLKNLLNPDSGQGHKRLWTYIKSRQQEQIAIASMEDNNMTYTDDLYKTNIFYCFTKEDISHLPILENNVYRIIDPLHGYILPLVVFLIYYMT